MIIPKKELNQLVEGIVKQLVPGAVEKTTKLVKVRGHVLIANGHTEVESPGGIIQKVKPNNNYLWHKPYTIPVNHRRRIKKIIEEAPNQEQMETGLSQYLFKFGDPSKYVNNNRKN